MMKNIDLFNNQSIETISQIVGNILTGSKINTMFDKLSLMDHSEQSTKWRRIAYVLNESQIIYKCGNKIIEMIEYVFHPTSSWFSDINEYKSSIIEINKCISFYGYELKEDGKIHLTTVSTTRTESELRFDYFKSKLIERNIHPDILRFCTIDIINNDFFSIILESSKAVYNKIRTMTGISKDGNTLIQTCFNEKEPIIVFNTLTTQSEVDSYSGFRQLLFSIGNLFRNPRAHDPKIFSYDNLEDCLDILGVISFALKKLDKCSINRYSLEKHLK